MKETTKLFLKAIGSISGEIHGLKSELQHQNLNNSELIKLHVDTNKCLSTFKDDMNTRFEALQIAWDRQLRSHLVGHLHNVEGLIERCIKKAMAPPKKPIVKPKKPVKKVVKKRIKK